MPIIDARLVRLDLEVILVTMEFPATLVHQACQAFLAIIQLGH